MELVAVSEESLFREVDEELRQEQYKKLWDKFGTYFVALCVVIVAAVAGFKGYEYYQVKQSQAAAVVYFDGVKRATDGFCALAREGQRTIATKASRASDAKATRDATGATATGRERTTVRVMVAPGEVRRPWYARPMPHRGRSIT